MAKVLYIYCLLLFYINLEAKPKPIQYSEIGQTVKIVNDSVFSPQLNAYKKIWIYLPTGYHTSKKNYSVTYMPDGEKASLVDPSSPAKQRADIYSTLGNFEKNNLQSGLLVAIVNGKAAGRELFSPFGANSIGDAYVDFIANTLKPYIDSAYRTMPYANKTAVMGGHWGSYISMYAWLKYPDVFGKLGVLNPDFWVMDSMNNFILSNPPRPTQKVYVYLGTGENKLIIDDMAKIFKLLKLSGLPEVQMVDIVTTDNDGRWEFGVAYQWLFFNNASLELDQMKGRPVLEFKKRIAHFTPIDLSKNYMYHIIDSHGKQFMSDEKLYKNSINMVNLPNGTYFVNLHNNSHSYLYKIVLE
ncbi:MAG: alpha/beta hydrolase-fold protein [Bacteroidota bacterium]|nr:alpha/beta hydrolase-fold protein [Bacteroidota bacterium]